MIEVRNLTKRYRDLVALDDVSFDVAQGEILGFLGRNGAGKTTCMRILTGCLAATSGTAKIAGFDVFEKPLEVKRRVGYLPENPPLYPDMTVHGYLKFVAEIKGLKGARIKGELERVANLTSVGAVMDRVIANLSKGFRQRVGLAQALLGDPDVLILDEPTVGLDPIQVREFRDLIRSLAGKHTVVLSTHILSEITATCQKALVIRQGRVVAFDDLEGLARSHQQQDRVISLEEIFVKLYEN
jgi:ABC-2 type transport system ATP-binding protein